MQFYGALQLVLLWLEAFWNSFNFSSEPTIKTGFPVSVTVDMDIGYLRQHEFGNCQIVRNLSEMVAVWGS